jgi:hypothetical protein
MNRQVKTYLLLAAICLIVALCNKAHAQKKVSDGKLAPLRNTTFIDTPKQYIYRVDALALERFVVLTDSIISHWGMEKGGTQIQQVQSSYTNKINQLKVSLRLDSLPVNKSIK